MDKITLSDIMSGYSLTKINDNFSKIEDIINNNVLGNAGDVFQGDFDANGKRIYNLPAPGNDNEAARLKDVRNAIAGLAGVTANLINFDPTNSVPETTVQGAILSVASRSPTPKDYGAKGDGVTDDTFAFNAWSLAVSQKGYGSITSGTYNLPVGFVAPSNATVVCAQGVVLDVSKGGDGVTCIQAYGSVSSSYAITSTPAIYGNTVALSISDASNFSDGDYVEVFSDDVADVSDRTGTPIGEMMRVSSVTGSTITFYNNMRCPLTYTTNPRIRKISFFENLTWHGGEIRGRTTGPDPAQIGIYGRYARNIFTYDVFTNKTMGIGHLWECSLNCWAHNPRTVDNRRPYSGYSVAVGYTSQWCGARGGDFTRSRHAFTTTGGTSGYGIPMDCGIVNARSRFATGDDFDTHSIGINIFILDCVSEYCGGSALNIECSDVRARIRAFKPAYHGVAISNYARALGTYDIEAEVTSAGQSIMRLDAGVIPANSYGMSRLTAKLNGTSIGSAIDVIWNSALPLASNIKISGSVKSDVSNNAVTLSYCKDPDLTGLKVECTNPSASAIKLDHCDGADLQGARGDLAPNSTGLSFYINSSNDVDLRGTKGRSPTAVSSRGISIDSTTRRCVFGDVGPARFIGHTTPIFISGSTNDHTGTLTASVTYDPPSLAGGSTQSTVVAVPNAVVGDTAEAAFTSTNSSIRWNATVTSSNSVTVTQINSAGGSIDMASGTLKVLVRKLG
jgi:hypothetical protein